MRKLAFTFIFVPLLLLACGREPAAPPLAPNFDIDNGPDFTGVVMRDAAPAGISWGDPATGLRLTIGYDPVALCADPTGYTEYDLVIYADKLLRNGRDNSLHKWTNARLAVWPFFFNECDLYTTMAPLATGYGDAVWVDNDFSGSRDANTNAWGWMVTGSRMAWTADGSPARLSAHVRLVWDKENPENPVFRLLTRMVNLR